MAVPTLMQKQLGLQKRQRLKKHVSWLQTHHHASIPLVWPQYVQGQAEACLVLEAQVEHGGFVQPYKQTSCCNG